MWLFVVRERGHGNSRCTCTLLCMHIHIILHVPEVLEGCVDIKASAVHVSDIGSSQFHFSDSQTGFKVLQKQRDGVIVIEC